MVDNEKPDTSREQPAATSDALDAYLPHALAKFALPPPNQLDSATAAESLTDADRRALSAMGSPLALVNQIVTDAKAASESAPQVNESTVALRGEHASTTGAQSRVNINELEDARLVRSLKAFDCVTRIDWQSRYRKVKELGRGGQGVVYLCDCLDEFGPRALKAFSPAPYRDAASYYEEMERMEHIASLVHRINSENVLDVDRLTDFDGVRVMVMRWVDGYDLRQLLQPSRLERIRHRVNAERWDRLNDAVVTFGPKHLRLQPGIAVAIIQDCLQGLDALHRRKIVHGDIKPSNIMLNCFGSAKLIDMGSAFELRSRPKQHTWTPQYAAPEVLESRIALQRGGNVDAAENEKWSTQSDLASLGYVLIELLAGQGTSSIPDIGEDSTRTTGGKVDVETLEAILDAKRSLPERLPELLPREFTQAKRLMRLCGGLIHPNPQKRSDAHEAIEGHAGTVKYEADLAKCNLMAAFRREIQRWIEELKNAGE